MRSSGRTSDGRQGWSLPRPRRALALCAAGLLCLCGCRSNQKSALVEAELRPREREVGTPRADLDRCEPYNRAIPSGMTAGVLACPAGPPGLVVDPPAAAMSGTVKQITLARGT